VAVASNRRDAAGLVRARGAGVPTATFVLDEYLDRAARDAAMAGWFDEHGVVLVVTAGYMHLLTEPFLSRFPNRIVNVHPSLLPAYPGRTPLEDALAAGEQEVGVTVHLVDEGIDSGPILAQEAVPVQYDDSVEGLRARVQSVEHRLLPETVLALAAGAVAPEPRR
jgi:phosphoribosylglycinamide formyltransferase-1